MSKWGDVFLLIISLFVVVRVNSYVTTFTPLEGISVEKTKLRSTGMIAGGWSEADPTSQDVLDASTWCVSNQYGTSSNMEVSIVSARKQIVAGTKYALNIAITDPTTSTCTMHVYVVVKKLPEYGVIPVPPYVLLESDTLDTACPPPAAAAAAADP